MTRPGRSPALRVEEARAILLDAIVPLPAEETGLDDALSRTLAEPVVADHDVPAADRSAMDGFAVRAADVARPGTGLRVVGEVRAGASPAGVRVGAGEAVRIFTGAVVPEGADAVVMLELATDDRPAATVAIHDRPSPGQHVRRRGEDRRAGETVVEAGSVLRAAHLGALAAVGRSRVRVVRAPRVAVLSTGDEVVPVEADPAPYQVRNSNAHALRAQLREMGIEGTLLGIAKDDRANLDALVARGLAADVLLMTGGVSVGAYDLVGEALARAGCEVLFHNVAMRPGKPILAARRGASLVLGLPGNPVSAFASFHVFVAAALRKLMGDPQPVRPRLRATLLEPLRTKPGRATWSPARLHWTDGRPVVRPVPTASSGDAAALAAADAYIVTDAEAGPLPAGSEVDVEPWAGPVR